jgi:hypothetical protein
MAIPATAAITADILKAAAEAIHRAVVVVEAIHRAVAAEAIHRAVAAAVATKAAVVAADTTRQSDHRETSDEKQHSSGEAYQPRRAALIRLSKSSGIPSHAAP